MQPRYDPSLEEFIRISERLGAEDDLHAQREAYGLSSRALALRVPDGVEFFDEVLQTREHAVSVRHYEVRDSRPRGLIVYFHGGGWVKGDLNSHHEVVAWMAARTGASMLAVEYPLAPENRHPAQLLCGYAVLQQVQARRAAEGESGPLLVAGDSAGGQLAAALCMLAGREGGPAISGQVLIYPALDHRCGSGSFERFSGGPLLTAESMKEYWRAVMPANGDPGHLLSPLLESDLSGLPPAIVQLAQLDVLHDEGAAFARRLEDEGVSVEVLDGVGMVHGFIRAIAVRDAARREYERLCDRVGELISRVSA